MAALQRIPSEDELRGMIGEAAFAYWQSACSLVDSLYDMEKIWSDGGKRWTYEYKFRRGGKTLCALYARQGRFGLMIIFGADERVKVEGVRAELSARTRELYDQAQTYHDGKWVMFDETAPLADVERLLRIKRRAKKAGA